MRAGGPSASGSFRDIHLRRGGKEVAVFDLYHLLLKGNRDTDALAQPDDVIFVGPVGPQVAVLGSVNQQAIYELRTGETLADALAHGRRLQRRRRPQLRRARAPGRHARPAASSNCPCRRTWRSARRRRHRPVFSVIAAALPQEAQNEARARRGRGGASGDYILPPGSRIADALRAAAALTSAAYPYGAEFSRESVRKQQQVNYERALRDLETDMSSARRASA